jgi:hypothetical protein
MNEIASLERDVLDCGVPLGESRALVKRYERALHSGACVDWIELYIGIFATLLRHPHCTRAADPYAARRLLQLLSDDLGVQLFDDDALRSLEQTLALAA